MCTIRFSVFLDQETDREQFDTFTTFEKFSLKLNVRVEKNSLFLDCTQWIRKRKNNETNTEFVQVS